MKFASLGSGSEGNALIVCAGHTNVLMDCGFSAREATRRLARLGMEPSQLSGIVVTHEHSDHISGVIRLARRYSIPVWLTHGTLRLQPSISDLGVVCNLIYAGQHFSIGDLVLQPYTVPHDAAEPVQFVFGDGQHRLGVLTDAGHTTSHILSVLNGCDALVLECNHDVALLAEGSYPDSLKRRVGGRLGHLNNLQSADLLKQLECRRLQHIVAAHLSQHNNTPDLATSALSQALGCAPNWIAVATQSEGVSWREII